MSDEVKAGTLTFIYIALLYVGGSVGDTNKLAGVVISIAATVAFIGILYGSWMLEQRDKREHRAREIYKGSIDTMAARYRERDAR